MWPHEDRDFADLLRIVASERGLSAGLVEKDYWVTHVLGSLEATKMDVWFKGGTSLSKGYALIQRFSEDLDLVIQDPAGRLPKVGNWKSDGTKATSERKSFFEALHPFLVVPGASVSSPESEDGRWRNGDFRVTYPGQFMNDLGGLSPFVRLEVGMARVEPCTPRSMVSFVHDKLQSIGQLSRFDDNRPRATRCVHPAVTLLDKLDALHRRFPRPGTEPAKFVRHYEDAARIIEAEGVLGPHGFSSLADLAEDMRSIRQISQIPDANDPAFNPIDSERWTAIRGAHAAIAPMFWGPRVPLAQACQRIRARIAILNQPA